MLQKTLKEQEKALNSAFESVEKDLNELILNPKVVKFSVITKLNEESLKESQFYQSEFSDGTICNT